MTDQKKERQYHQMFMELYVKVVKAYARSMPSRKLTVSLPPLDMVDQMTDEIVRLRQMAGEKSVEKS